MEVINQLNNKKVVSGLTTAEHVKWIIEVIGQGFTLPMNEQNDFNIIKKCAMVYRNWFLRSKDNTPPGLSQNIQFFFKEMIGHITIAFDLRPHMSDTFVISQAALCIDLIDNILLPFFRTKGQFERETWIFFIRAIFGVIDFIYRDNEQPHISAVKKVLIKRVGPVTFRLAFELLLLSETRDEENVWQVLYDLIQNWVCVAVIRDWNSIFLALTQRSTSLMYGPQYGGLCGERLVIQWANDNGELTYSYFDLEPSYTYFFWQHLVNIFPESRIFLDPEVHRLFFDGLLEVVDCYLRVLDFAPRDPDLAAVKLPSSNSILLVVGRWIFKTLLKLVPKFEEGDSIAVVILCKIICRRLVNKGEESLKSHYLPLFYSILHDCLMKPLNKPALNIYAYANNIFSLELPGVTILVPSFMAALRRLWGTKVNLSSRGDAIKLLSTLVCYPFYYKWMELARVNLDLVSQQQGEQENEISNFLEVKESFKVVMEVALRDDPASVVKIMGLFTVFVLEVFIENEVNEKDPDFGFTISFLKQIFSNIKDNWDVEVCISVYMSLSSLVEVYPYVSDSLGIYLVQTVLNETSKHILVMVASKDKAYDELICTALLTASEWIILNPAFPEVLDYQLAMKAINNAMELQKEDVFSSKVHQAANYALSKIMRTGTSGNSLGLSERDVVMRILEDFRNLRDLVKTTPLQDHESEDGVEGDLNERDGKKATFEDHLECEEMNIGDLKDFMDPVLSEYSRYFILEKSLLLSMIEVPIPGNLYKANVYLIIRSPVGKYVWVASISLGGSGEGGVVAKGNEDIDGASMESFDIGSHLTQIGVERYAELLDYLHSIRSQHRFEGSLLNLVEDYIGNEQEYLEANGYGLEKAIGYRIREKERPYGWACKFVYGRVLLSHLGLLNFDSYERLVPLSEKGESLIEDLDALDEIPERLQISTAIVRIDSNGQPDYRYQFDEDCNPTNFTEFLYMLGWKMDPMESCRSLGPLKSEMYEQHCGLYYANHSVEIFFTISSWIPVRREDLENSLKRRSSIVSNAGPVLVIWNESLSYNFKARSNFCLLVITPMTCGLFSIRVYMKNYEELNIGPIIDGMILTKKCLGPMIRQAVIRITKYLLPDRNVLTPQFNRNKAISSIKKKHSKSMKYRDFLMYLTLSKASKNKDHPSHSSQKNFFQTSKVDQTT